MVKTNTKKLVAHHPVTLNKNAMSNLDAKAALYMSFISKIPKLILKYLRDNIPHKNFRSNSYFSYKESVIYCHDYQDEIDDIFIKKVLKYKNM